MATLIVNEKEYKARTDFAFLRRADERYQQEDSNGNKMDGFMSMYLNLLDENSVYLASFWDCALAHLKERPSLHDIDEALMNRIEKDGEVEPAFKEVFKTFDDAVFFKGKVNAFWKDLENIKDEGDTEKEKEQNKEMLKKLKESRKKLKS